MTPSPIQLLIVGAIIVLLFGASRFADLGRGLGEGIRNFKKGVSDDGSSDASDSDAPQEGEGKTETKSEAKES